MKSKQILVVIKEPGKAPTVDYIENDLKAFQEAVGGYIEAVTLATDCIIICNEEGMLQGLPHNCRVANVDFCGTILVVGARGDEFASLKSSVVPFVMDMLGR